MDAPTAARIWKREIEPLKEHGIRLGAPAVRNGDVQWLQDFYTHCAGDCTTHFTVAHFYGDAAGLASWVSLLNTTYENITEVWVTEFAYPDGSLLETQQAFNASIAFMDSQTLVSPAD